MKTTLLTTNIHFEQDVVMARQRTWQIAKLLGFDTQDQTRLATAVSEIARNAFGYAQSGTVKFSVVGESPLIFQICVCDRGPGILNLQEVLNGEYVSATGMGLGIIGAKRLMDGLEIESIPGQGTKVVMSKNLPKQGNLLTVKDLEKIATELAQQQPQNPYEEIKQQNQQLLQALDSLRKRDEQLTQVNQELEETNRGVIALYAELDEKANSLRRVNELKTRFLSYTSHEFRTPLNSIISMSRLLLDRMDGELTEEQEKQINYIRQAAAGLSELVNDLLDLAKVESGKITVNPHYFQVEELFGTLRGLMRPLVQQNPNVSLIFEQLPEIPNLYTDESKVAQILRNFISNALKYTERGEVKVKAELDANKILFAVADTGIGIAPHDQKRIFEDFTQLDSPIQKKVKGTGLGLPLSRRLAELLGGNIFLKSELGVGSTFFLSMPLLYQQGIENNFDSSAGMEISSVREIESTEEKIKHEIKPKLLLIDDDIQYRYFFGKILSNYQFSILEAGNGYDGIRLAQIEQPQIIFLDLLMPELSGLEVLEILQSNPATRNIPVVVNTSQNIESELKKTLEKHTIAILSKDTTSMEVVMVKIRATLVLAGIIFEEET